ncbi:MAG TPA: ABC transporter ATP-binding protein [Thermomicrobiales bacterium]|nr:ABC transporter ATP-binding protein [Thermomicrobiales bacterium]
MTEAAPTATAPFAIEMRDIVKRFPGVVANDGITLQVRQGEIHALLGENGAGKSTLMNILFGLYAPDEGQVFVNDKPANFHGPREAVHAGLGMVHQHFMLIPRFTVTENVILGAEGPVTMLDRKSAARRVAGIARSYGLDIDPDARVEDISVGLQQRVEILRALYQGSRMLILDEPTALLTPQEIEDLYGVLDRLRAAGGTIIFITHKLREVAAVSDRVTVIRRGKTIGTRETKGTTPQELAEMMVGRGVSLTVERQPAAPGETILEARNLQARSDHGHRALDIESLRLRRGEILGVCGVEGNGQGELVEILSGLREWSSGSLLIGGHDVKDRDPNGFRDAGLSYIPEDRHHRGLVLDFPLWENVLLGNTEREPFVRGGMIDSRASQAITRSLMEKYDVRAPSPTTQARNLSGGNQQKLIIARELQRNPDVLLAIQPTRGLDVGAIEFVHKALIEVRDAGKAVLLVSYDLDEILDLSDRIVVLYQGRITGEFLSGQVSRSKLGLFMGGRTTNDADAIPTHS